MTIAWSVDTQGLCLKTDLFSDLPYRSYVSGENGPQKRNFSKMLPRVEIFENAHFSFTCGRTKLVGFRIRCDDIMCIIASSILLVWRMLRKGCYSISIVLAFSRVQAKTIPIRYIWIRISKCADEASVFTKQGENISVNVVCNRAFFRDVISAILVSQTMKKEWNASHVGVPMHSWWPCEAGVDHVLYNPYCFLMQIMLSFG